MLVIELVMSCIVFVKSLGELIELVAWLVGVDFTEYSLDPRTTDAQEFACDEL